MDARAPNVERSRRRRQVQVLGLTASYAGSVELEEGRNQPNRVVMEPSPSTIAALGQIGSMTCTVAAKDAEDRTAVWDPTLTQVSKNLIERRFDDFKSGADNGETSQEVERLDRPVAIARLQRLSIPPGLPADDPGASYVGAPAGGGYLLRPQPVGKAPPPAPMKKGRGRGRPRKTPITAPLNRTMKEIVSRTPGTLGLSARIAAAAMKSLLKREESTVVLRDLTVEGERSHYSIPNVRRTALENILKPKGSEDGPSGYLAPSTTLATPCTRHRCRTRRRGSSARTRSLSIGHQRVTAHTTCRCL